MTITRKLGIGAAAAALSISLVACANEEGNAGADATVEETATETNTMTETASPAEATTAGTEAAEGAAEGDTVPVTTADGAEAMVPAGLKEAMDKYTAPEYGGSEWGEPVKVEETDGGWVATYDENHYITWNENTGGAPIWGKIAETWVNEDMGKDGVGFPTAPESPIPGEFGWTQEFENGTITWALDKAKDEFAPTIEVK